MIVIGDNILQIKNNNKLISSNVANSLFNKTFQILQKKLSLFVWQGFFEPLAPISFKDNILTFSASSAFQRDWIKDHYIDELISAAKIAAKKSININVIHDPKAHIVPKIYQPKKNSSNFKSISIPFFNQQTNSTKKNIQFYKKQKTLTTKGEEFLLDNKYSFDSFVEGPSNKICLSAGYAVVQNPGTKFSPLFLFGAVGLGKTHLLHAIGLAAKAKHPGFRVLYVSAEQWVNSYITAIREKKFDDFRKQFRASCDMLLVDDIQFLAGKEASQDEFFHTFNALHNAHKQIVVTSDKYPHEISGFEQRLKTRLSWGLFADIAPPEFNTRIAILEKKSRKLGLILPKEIFHFIASKISSSVRELEGALIRLYAYKSLTQNNITLSQAKIYLAPILHQVIKPTICAKNICQKIASYYKLSIDDILGKSRQKQVSFARRIAMSICRSHLDLTLVQIGLFFGGRDHSTISTSIKKINKIRLNDISVQSVFNHIERSLFN